MQNRYKIHDELLNYHNINKPVNTISDMSTDKKFSTDEESSNSLSIDKELKFDIDCESIIYKSNEKV